MSSSIEITPELLSGFLDEAPEYLEMMDEGLMEFESKAGDGILSLEAPEDREQMNTMFRAAHSLKGLAAAFGFEKIKELTHLMETLFDQVRMNKRDLTVDSFETLFKVFDRLKALVAELSDDSGDDVQIDDVLAALNRVLDDEPGTTTAESTDSGDTADSEAADEVAVPVASLEQSEVLNDPELAALFLETTLEAIEELNQGLVGLEEQPADADLLNKVFRCAHNIKGASGAAGLSGMNRLTHDMETVFDHLRSARLSLNDELMNALFQTVDRLRRVIDGIKEGTNEDVQPGELLDPFAKWVESVGDSDSDSASGAAAGGAPVSNSDAAQSAGGVVDTPESVDEGCVCVTVVFGEGNDEAAIQAYLIHNKLGDFGTVVGSDPDIDEMSGDTAVTAVCYTLESETPASEIERIISTFPIERVTVSGAAEPHSDQVVADAPKTVSSVASQPATATPAPPANAPPKQADPAPKTSSPPAPAASTPKPTSAKPVKKVAETLRVDQERLDHLMNLGGELVINRARFSQIHGQFRGVFDGKNLGYLVDDISEQLGQLGSELSDLGGTGGISGHAEELSSRLEHLELSFNPLRALVGRVHELKTSMLDFDEALHGLTRVSEEIQKGIMSTRLVPVGPLFTRFKRVVRDITKANGKSVDLVLRGEHTELDKRMIDELGDPLTHMVRNSVDHGIESPDVRIAAGKEPMGTLVLEACHRGNSICISVTDDGAGVNIERVKAKIVENELATPEQVESMTDRDIVQYIFKPGFSTAEKVTDVSGRGMGMDIVISKIDKLNGTVEVDSTPGKGSVVVIKLPLTLAILTSMVARVGKGVYAIPLESVAEIITIRRADIQRIQRREVVRVRDRIVPIAFFEDIFDCSLSGLKTITREAAELTLVIVESDGEQIGLVVDELYGQEDAVIKSIAENYRNVRGVAGASIRGDGTVSLILDVNAMLAMSGKRNAERAVAAPVGAGAEG